MKIIAIILSSLTSVLAFISIGATACTRTSEEPFFPVPGWIVIATCIAAVVSTIVVVIALKR